MNKRLIVAYSIFSLIVFSFLIVWFVFRAINTRSANINEANTELESVKRTIASSYLTEGSYSSEYFAAQMKDLVTNSDYLKAVAIISNSTTVEYVYSSDASFLKLPPDGLGTPQAPPMFVSSKIQDVVISSAVVVPTTAGVQVETMFRIFRRSDVFPIIRELLIGLLSFLLVTAIMILISPHLKKINGSLPEVENKSDDDALSEQTQKAPPVPTKEPNDEPADDEDTDGRLAGLQSQPPALSQTIVQNEVRGLYSPTTNLGWEDYLIERLSAELKRAASFDQDLVLLLCTVRGASKEGKQFAAIAETACEFFNFRDLSFEYGSSGIGVIIPNIDLDQGIDRAEIFMEKAKLILSHTRRNIKIVSGLSARNGRLISGDRIIREAEGALKKAWDEPNGIVAFRVDPQKYRQYISSKSTS